jgi:hypothetical protein
MHLCRNCGKQVDEGSPFRSNWGAKQAERPHAENANAGQAETATPSVINPVVTAAKKTRLGKKLGLGCGGLILLIPARVHDARGNGSYLTVISEWEWTIKAYS